MLKLVERQEIRYKKGRWKGVVCRLCGSDITRILPSNEMPLWIKDKNSYGERTSQYLCYDCAHQNTEIKRCSICKDTKYLYRIFDTDAYWTGKYECIYCKRKKKDNNMKR